MPDCCFREPFGAELGQAQASQDLQPGGRTDMNEKSELLLIETMDLINRAKGMIELLYAEERHEAWTLPLETAVNHLADAHGQLKALIVDDPKSVNDPSATAS
jgi:hypothetical protein